MENPETREEILDRLSTILVDLLEIDRHDVKLNSHLERDLGAGEYDYISIYLRILIVFPSTKGEIKAFSYDNKEIYTVTFIGELLAKHYGIEWFAPALVPV